MKKIKYLFMLMAFSFFILATKTDAASGSLSVYANYVTVYNGTSVVVTVNASGLSGNFSVTSSNPGVLSGGIGAIWLEKESKTFTFNAKAVGSATITVYPTDVSHSDDGSKYSVAKAVTIRVINRPVVVLSTNNNLSSLKVEGFNIEPAFDKDKLEYNLTVDSVVEKINITAVPADTTAVITGNGERVVSEGENKLEVNVTAQNGAVKKYIINVNVKELNPIVIRIDDKDYNLVRKKSVLKSPKTYSETTVTIKDTEIPAFKSDITGYTLVGLKDSEGKIKLYIYNKSKESYTEYNETEFTKNTLYIMPYDKTLIPDSYKLYTMKIDGENREVYKISKSSKYALLQGMNIETGEEYLYLYDSLEKTVQRFYDEDNKKLEELNKYYLIALASTGALTLILFISLISKSSKLRKLKRKEKEVITVESDIEDVESNDEEDFLLVDSISSKKNKKSKKK